MLRLNDRVNRWFDNLPHDTRFLAFLSLMLTVTLVSMLVGVVINLSATLSQLVLLAIFGYLRLAYLGRD